MTKKSLSETNKELAEMLAQARRVTKLPEDAIYMLSDERLSGVDERGPLYAATFEIGRDFSTLRDLIGEPVSGLVIGGLLSDDDIKNGVVSIGTIVSAVVGLRLTRAGREAEIGATIVQATGVYEGVPEETVRFEIRWSEKESPGREIFFNQFRRNIVDMCEALCSSLAQAEIQIIFDEGSKRTLTVVSPKGLSVGHEAQKPEIERLKKIDRLSE